MIGGKDVSEIRKEEFFSLPETEEEARLKTKLFFTCVCGKRHPASSAAVSNRESKRCSCGLIWKLHPDFASAKAQRGGSWQVPLEKEIVEP